MIRTKIKNSRKKVRVNITVDKEALERAKTKLKLFGGKVSTLFNSYLDEFVETMDKKADESHKSLKDKLSDIEKRLKKIEDKEK